MVNQESLTCDAFLQKRIRYTHSVQEEVVGGPKMPFLFTFRVKNAHVHMEVGGGQKREKLCPLTKIPTLSIYFEAPKLKLL